MTYGALLSLWVLGVTIDAALLFFAVVNLSAGIKYERPDNLDMAFFFTLGVGLVTGILTWW